MTGDVMRVMVTGATGFVGGRVAARLHDRGDEVLAAVRTPSARLASMGLEQMQVGLDLTPDLLEGVEGVVHAAAGFGASLDEARAVNRDGTRRVVDAALAAGVRRLVHLSTVSVYDLAVAGDVTVDEDAPLSTERSGASPAGSSGSAYSITKAESEAEVLEARARGLSAAILRPPAVLGAGPTSTWGTRMPRRVWEAQGPARSTETTFAFVHIEDLVDTTIAALDADVQLTANVVGGHTTWGTYLLALADVLPGEVTLPAPADDAAWRGDYATDRLPRELGVTPTRTFEDAMAEIAASWTDGPPDAR